MSNQIRRLSSHYVLTPLGLLKHGIVSFDSTGQVINISQGGNIDAEHTVEFFNGILVPSFVNAHCHLELSYLHNKISRGCGFDGFVEGITSARNLTTIDERIAAAQYRDAKMYSQGVGAIGDVCNDSYTFDLKSRSKIKYHNFIEFFGLTSDNLDKVNAKALEADAFNLPNSVTPHSIYSVQDKPFQQIALNNNPLSVHFMESIDEQELFSGHGKFSDRNRKLGLSIDFASYDSPTLRIIKSIPKNRDILLIHNTFVTQSDVEAIENHFSGNITWVLCPQSNLFIENAEPPADMLLRMGVHIAIGTDSLASNDDLSIIAELKALKNIPLTDLLEWATIGGACALGFDNTMGSFETGKRPGAVLIEGIDWKNMRLEPNASSRRIL